MRLLAPWLLLAPLCAQDAVGFPHWLARLADPSWLTAAPLAGERCVQFSSFDRASTKGPGDHEAWYANGDRGQYLRVDGKGDAREFVMAEVDGPGVIARIWSANPRGTLHFDLDGARVWSVDFAALCSGKVAGIPEPLAGMRARGANCHLPIPFGKKLKLSQTLGDSYYQVNVLQLPAGTAVETFAPAMLERHADAIAAAGRALAPVNPQLDAEGVGAEIPLAAGEVVVWFAISIDEAPAGHTLGELLRQVLLVIECGGETTARVPLLDFFAAGADWRPHRGRFLGIDADRTAHCWFRMPMPGGGRLLLQKEGGPASFQPRFRGVRTVRGERRPDEMLFRADWHQRKNVPTRPFHDHLVLDAKGMGRFVGCALLVKNPVKAWWGEGDEKFWVDGEAFPSTFGTGTEDYFGYAWCDPGCFSSPLHGQTQCDGPGNYGCTAVHRMHVLDAVPFQKSFRFDLEVWHWVPDIVMDYATVAYWYGAPGARSGLPAMPPAAERTLDRLPAYQMFAVDGAIEAERLDVVECTGGRHVVQDMGFTEGFSQEGQRWWMDGKVGDRLTLALPVAAAGRYRVKVGLCTAADYAQVQVSCNGSGLGAPIEGYHDGVRASGPLDLGIVELPAGPAKLTFAIAGRHERAIPRHMVGVDYVLLEAVR